MDNINTYPTEEQPQFVPSKHVTNTRDMKKRRPVAPPLMQAKDDKRSFPMARSSLLNNTWIPFPSTTKTSHVYHTTPPSPPFCTEGRNSMLHPPPWPHSLGCALCYSTAQHNSCWPTCMHLLIIIIYFCSKRLVSAACTCRFNRTYLFSFVHCPPESRLSLPHQRAPPTSDRPSTHTYKRRSFD